MAAKTKKIAALVAANARLRRAAEDYGKARTQVLDLVCKMRGLTEGRGTRVATLYLESYRLARAASALTEAAALVGTFKADVASLRRTGRRSSGSCPWPYAGDVLNRERKAAEARS